MKLLPRPFVPPGRGALECMDVQPALPAGCAAFVWQPDLPAPCCRGSQAAYSTFSLMAGGFHRLIAAIRGTSNPYVLQHCSLHRAASLPVCGGLVLQACAFSYVRDSLRYLDNWIWGNSVYEKSLLPVQIPSRLHGKYSNWFLKHSWLFAEAVFSNIGQGRKLENLIPICAKCQRNWEQRLGEIF